MHQLEARVPVDDDVLEGGQEEQEGGRHGSV